jgi:hypothetical protein
MTDTHYHARLWLWGFLAMCVSVLCVTLHEGTLIVSTPINKHEHECFTEYTPDDAQGKHSFVFFPAGSGCSQKPSVEVWSSIINRVKPKRQHLWNKCIWTLVTFLKPPINPNRLAPSLGRMWKCELHKVPSTGRAVLCPNVPEITQVALLGQEPKTALDVCLPSGCVRDTRPQGHGWECIHPQRRNQG